LAGVAHEVPDRAHFADLLVYEGPAFPQRGLFFEEGFVQGVAADEAMASRQPLRRRAVDALEDHFRRPVVDPVDRLDHRAAREVGLGRYESHLVAFLQKKRKARRASHDEPSV